MSARPFTVLLSACEPSGDALGAGLMAELRRQRPDVRFIGIGGPAMAEQGLVSLFDIAELGIYGISEVIPKLFKLVARIRQVADLAIAERPDVAVLIDSGDFNHRVARRIRRRVPAMPIVKYVSSQVWASRPGRAVGMPAYLDLILCLLPFEPAFYECYKMRAIFVGHPAVERGALMVGGNALRERLQVSGNEKLLCVLPGSRRTEIRILLPVFRDVVARLTADIPNLVCVLPTVSAVEKMVRAELKDWPTPIHLLTTTPDRFAAFDGADAALAASGTVATELAVAGCPMVVAYKVGWLSALIFVPLITVQYMTIANLVLGRRAVPEFPQDKVKVGPIVEALRPLLTDPAAAEEQRASLKEAVGMLQTDEGPSRRAAGAIFQLLDERRA